MKDVENMKDTLDTLREIITNNETKIEQLEKIHSLLRDVGNCEHINKDCNDLIETAITKTHFALKEVKTYTDDLIVEANMLAIEIEDEEF